MISDPTVVAALDLTTSEILSLSVIAALVTTIGNLVATWLKDFVFARSLERWKERQSLQSVYRRYRDPLLLSARELRSRMAEISKQYPVGYLRSSVLDKHPDIARNLATDPYYQRYRLVSTVFRLCAFLGWLELYRQEITFLDSGKKRLNRELDQAFKAVRGDLADGQLNDASDWHEWSDRLIFREEQRAIGESMIIRSPNPGIMGYARFNALFERADTDEELWWLRVGRGFFLDPEPDRDFRRNRAERMRDDLGVAIDLMAHSPGTLRAKLNQRRARRALAAESRRH